jgi:hypothetical protein
LRWDTGTDWYSYYSIFLGAEWDNIFSHIRHGVQMEYGYVLLNVLIKSIGGNYTLFLLLTNFFVLMAYMKFAVTNSNAPVYTFVLFIFSTQFFPVRIGIAVAFIILGLCDFSQKKHFRIVIYTLIAMSIHLSAIIFIPVWFLFFCKRIPTVLAVTVATASMILAGTNILNSALLSISVIFNYMDAGMIADKFEHYLDFSESLDRSFIVSNIISVIYITILIPFGYTVDKMTPEKGKSNYTFLYNVYFVFIILGIIFSSDNMINLKRLQNYFVFAFVILFSTLLHYGKQKYPTFRAGFTIIFIGFALFRSYMLFFSGYVDLYFPYISIFHDNIIR